MRWRGGHMCAPWLGLFLSVIKSSIQPLRANNVSACFHKLREHQVLLQKHVTALNTCYTIWFWLLSLLRGSSLTLNEKSHFYINHEMYVVLSCLSQTALHSLPFALSLHSQIKNSVGSEIY